MEIEIWKDLLKISPVVALMGYAIYWLAKRLKESENEKKELNAFVNKNNLETLQTLMSVNNTLDQFINSHKELAEKIKEINQNNLEATNQKYKNLKDSIELKLEIINQKIK